MVQFVDQEPEFEDWPSIDLLQKDQNSAYDKNVPSVIQPEIDFNQEENNGQKRDNLKPDVSRDMYFECLREFNPRETNIV